MLAPCGSAAAPRLVAWQRLRLPARCGDAAPVPPDASGAPARGSDGAVRACVVPGEGTMVYFARLRSGLLASDNVALAWAFKLQDGTLYRVAHRDAPASLAVPQEPAPWVLAAFVPYALHRAIAIVAAGNRCEALDVRIEPKLRFRLDVRASAMCLAAPRPSALPSAFGTSGAPSSKAWAPTPPPGIFAFVRGLEVHTAPWQAGITASAFAGVADDLKGSSARSQVLRVCASHSTGIVLVILLRDSTSDDRTPTLWECRGFRYEGPNASQWPCARFAGAADACFAGLDDANVITLSADSDEPHRLVVQRYAVDSLASNDSSPPQAIARGMVRMPPADRTRGMHAPRIFAAATNESAIVTTCAHGARARVALRRLAWSAETCTEDDACELALGGDEEALDVRWMPPVMPLEETSHAAVLTTQRLVIVDTSLVPLRMLGAASVSSVLWIGPLLTYVDAGTNELACLLWNGSVLPLASPASTPSGDMASLVYGDGDTIAVGVGGMSEAESAIALRNASLLLPLVLALATRAACIGGVGPTAQLSAVHRLTSCLDASRTSAEALRMLARCCGEAEVVGAAPWLRDFAHVRRVRGTSRVHVGSVQIALRRGTDLSELPVGHPPTRGERPRSPPSAQCI